MKGTGDAVLSRRKRLFLMTSSVDVLLFNAGGPAALTITGNPNVLLFKCQPWFFFLTACVALLDWCQVHSTLG